jgi:hypothetical protein
LQSLRSIWEIDYLRVHGYLRKDQTNWHLNFEFNWQGVSTWGSEEGCIIQREPKVWTEESVNSELAESLARHLNVDCDVIVQFLARYAADPTELIISIVAFFYVAFGG